MPGLIDHPSVSHAEVYEAAMRDGTMSTRLLVRTDLVMDPDAAGFDKAEHGRLMDAIKALMSHRPDIEAADIEGR